MNTTDRFVKMIQRFDPELMIETVNIDQSGQNNVALIINDRWLFRFPKYPAGMRALAQEVNILQAIHSRLPLSIPTPRYVHLHTNRVNESFVGYPLLPGQPLHRDTFQDYPKADQERIVARLIEFLQALHSIPIDPVVGPLQLPLDDTLSEWQSFYQQLQQKLFPYMREDARRTVQLHFEHYFQDRRLHLFQPVLRHGDFGFGNILYDVEAGEVTGVIDFGSAGLGDPAIDFAGLLGFGIERLDEWSTVYPGLPAMQGRIAFYRGTFALQEALFGLTNGDQAAFESGMARYR